MITSEFKSQIIRNMDSVRKILQAQNSNAKIIAVTKGHQPEVIPFLASLEIEDIGENYIQELKTKAVNKIPSHRWHYLGNIQSNKIRDIVSNCEVIQSINSDTYLEKINTAARKQNKTIQACIQIKQSATSHRPGLVVDGDNYKELKCQISQYSNITFEGLMTVMENDASKQEKINWFEKMHDMYQTLGNCNMLSMGMSNDYSLAIACGSTHVRLGTILLGMRLYNNRL